MRVGRLPSDGNSETIRTTLTLLLSACATIAGAQLVNASFEDGLNGWQVNNYIGFDTVSLTTEVPPGGGEQSMAMLTNGYDVAFENQVVQPLGDLPPGTVVQFGGWMRALVSGAVVQTPPSIALCTCNGDGAALPVGPELLYTGPQYSWTFHQASLTIPGSPPPGSTHCLKLGSGVVYQNLNFQVWFDELFIEVDAATGAADMTSLDKPRSRPNPATDKLWIDLHETPLSITAIDASGRTHSLKNFNYRDRTLEVDVSSVPSGITLLRITTSSGPQNLRFIKL